MFLLHNLKTIITLDSLFIISSSRDCYKGNHYHALKNAGPVQLILTYHPEIKINTIDDIKNSCKALLWTSKRCAYLRFNRHKDNLGQN